MTSDNERVSELEEKISPELPICPFFRKKCIQWLCVAYIVELHRGWYIPHFPRAVLQEAYIFDDLKGDRKMVEKEETESTWFGLKKTKVKRSWIDDNREFKVIKKYRIGNAHCSSLKFDFGDVVMMENVDPPEWKKNPNMAVSQEEFSKHFGSVQKIPFNAKVTCERSGDC